MKRFYLSKSIEVAKYGHGDGAITCSFAMPLLNVEIYSKIILPSSSDISAKKIYDAVLAYSRNSNEYMELAGGITISNKFRGSYIGDYLELFDSDSIMIELPLADQEKLIDFAKGLAEVLESQSFVVTCPNMKTPMYFYQVYEYRYSYLANNNVKVYKVEFAKSIEEVKKRINFRIENKLETFDIDSLEIK